MLAAASFKSKAGRKPNTLKKKPCGVHLCDDDDDEGNGIARARIDNDDVSIEEGYNNQNLGRWQ